MGPRGLSSARPPPAPGGHTLAIIATGGLLPHTEWEPLVNRSRTESLHGAAVLLRGSNWKAKIQHARGNSKNRMFSKHQGSGPFSDSLESSLLSPGQGVKEANTQGEKHTSSESALAVGAGLPARRPRPWHHHSRLQMPFPPRTKEFHAAEVAHRSRARRASQCGH